MAHVDNTKLLLVLPPNQTTDAVSLLDDDLREFTKRCCRNWLLLNEEKTKLLVIGAHQLLKTLPSLSVTLMGKNIEPVTAAKDLGVYIDNNLNYPDHINKISASCIYKLIMINHIKYLLDTKTVLLLISFFSRGYAKHRNDYLLGDRLCKCVTHSDVNFLAENLESLGMSFL